MAIICPWCEREIDVPEIVEIDPDAELPENPYQWSIYLDVQSALVREGMEIMKKAGWRRVIG